jgi:hypothetical protein
MPPAERRCYTSGRPFGDVAQLGEHRVRIAGVRGSSPLISTISTLGSGGDFTLPGFRGMMTPISPE